MKLLLMTGGVALLAAALAAGQVPPTSQPAPVVGKVADPATAGPVSAGKDPAVVKPLETGANPGSDLEFKPPVENEGPPPPPALPVVKGAAPKQPARKAAQATAPPAGPRVIDAPAGPAVLPEAAAAPTILPGSMPGRPATPGGKNSKPYVIGPLDVLEVKVWNDPKLSGMVDVATDGTISMNLIGPVVASGLTVAELTASLKNRLTDVIIEPEVNVQVLRINSKKYSIFGGCFRAGEFPLVGEVTILDAFANCGGFKDFANLKGIYVLRGTQRLKFNYRDVIKGKHMEQNIVLENGDRIVIPE